ncbi:MAG: hypothetical protein ACFFBI_10485 [Promethearchaeota archaeon]
MRSLIIQVCGVEQGKIQEEEEKLLSNKSFLKAKERDRELNKQFWAIERPLRASILLCPACFKTDKDMTYNPVLKTWYCTDCYAKLKKGYAEDGQADQFP